MRENIEKKRDAIRKRVNENGHSDGTEIATQEEMQWLVEQVARDGIMLSVSASPGTWQKGNECYYYYWAMSVNAEKDDVRQFVDLRSLMTVGALNKLLNDTEEPTAVENIKKIRRLIQTRDRHRRRRQREREMEAAELEEELRIDVEREEAANNRSNLDWLVERIESMGWEVTLRKKIPPSEKNNS